MGRKAKAEGRCVHIWLSLFAVQQKRTHCKAVSGSLGARSCLTLATLWTVAPPGSSVRGVSQARMLEWVATPSSRGSF